MNTRVFTHCRLGIAPVIVKKGDFDYKLQYCNIEPDLKINDDTSFDSLSRWFELFSPVINKSACVSSLSTKSCTNLNKDGRSGIVSKALVTGVDV